MTKVKEYRTTKEECQRRIDERACVCPGCGGPIIPFETVDNSGNPTFWAGCEHCQAWAIIKDMISNRKGGYAPAR